MKQSNNDPKAKRQPSKLQAFSLIVFMAVVFFIGSKLGMNYVPLIALVAMYACLIARSCGYSWEEIEKEAGRKIGGLAPIFAILLSVGALVGALIYCGTVPMLIYYGTKFFSPRWLYLCAFLLCSIFSVLTGTSHGSISTAGLAMISLGRVMPGANIPMLAGAIVCGAIVGDKISPFSDTTLMAAAVTGNNVYDHVAHQAKTVVPAACIASVIYLIIGFTSSAGGVSLTPETIALQEALDRIYDWNILLIIPAIIVIWGAVTRKPTAVTIIGAVISALIIGSIVQGFSLADGVKCVYDGFQVSMIPHVDPDSLPDAVLTICNRGGMTAFVKTVYTILICYFFAAAAELAGTLQVILDVADRFVKNSFTLVLSTGISMVVMNSLCGSSTPSASMVGPMLKPKYEEMGLHSLNLARSIEDFGTGSTAFIPWTASGALYAEILGVSNLAFFPYSFFIITVWIIALFYAATGIGMMKYEKSES